MLEKTLESPLDYKEIQPVHPKGNQFWILIGRTAAEAETPILWPADTKSWPIGKDPDSREVWRQEEKGTTEDEIVRWHHWLNGHEFEQALGVGEGKPGVLQSMDRVTKSWTWLSDWTELNWRCLKSLIVVSTLVQMLCVNCKHPQLLVILFKRISRVDYRNLLALNRKQGQVICLMQPDQTVSAFMPGFLLLDCWEPMAEEQTFLWVGPL